MRKSDTLLGTLMILNELAELLIFDNNALMPYVPYLFDVVCLLNILRCIYFI